MKNLLLLVCIILISAHAFGQKKGKVQNVTTIKEFKSRMNLSTSIGPITLLSADTVSSKELWPKVSFKTRLSKVKHLKSTKQGRALIDTAYTFNWKPEIQQWDTVPIEKIIYTYDKNNNLTNYLSLIWNSSTQSWQNNTQIINTYNESNQLVNVIRQNWQYKVTLNYTWINSYKNIITYDQSGHESNFTYQTWNSSKNSWVSSWQHIFTYDSIGNNTSVLEKKLNSKTNKWTNSINSINQFDSLGHITLNLLQLWVSNVWTNGAQSIYGYDSIANNTSMLYQTWDSDIENWENCELKTSIYNKNKKNEYNLIQLWDFSISNWTNNEKSFYEYDSIGNNTSLLGQTYNPIDSSWINNWKNLYEFDPYNTQISNAILYWESGAGTWNSGTITKQLIGYSSDPSLTKKASIETIDNKTINEEIVLEIFPNPTSDRVNIRNNSEIIQVRIFDMLGNEMFFNNYYGLNIVQLDVADLKSGSYIIMVKDLKGNSTTKRLFKR